MACEVLLPLILQLIKHSAKFGKAVFNNLNSLVCYWFQPIFVTIVYLPFNYSDAFHSGKMSNVRALFTSFFRTPLFEWRTF